MIGVSGDIGPDEANEDASPVVSLLTVKFTATILELADERCVQSAIIDIGERLAPLMCLGIVEQKHHSFERRGRVAGLKLFQVGAPIPYLSDGNNAVRFNPGIGSGEWMRQKSDRHICANSWR